MTLFRRWLPSVFWMSLIFLLSAQERLPRPSGISPDIQALAGHFGAYAILALLLLGALAHLGWSFATRAAIAFVVAVLYGVSDEIHQSFVPGRDPSAFDVGIDALGAAVALIGRRVLAETGRRPGVADDAGDSDQRQQIGERQQQIG
ncbi:MAG: VanZ family protein [Thermomicrobiales bacterium]